jgi:type IV pilus assembly protein PilA
MQFTQTHLPTPSFEGEQNKMRNRQKGFSLIELLIVVAIILIIAAIAIPDLLRARMAANESSAVGSLRSINTAEVIYYSEYPGTGYSADLPSLGAAGASPCVAATTSACLIDDVVATATTAVTAKSGYFFTYTPGAVAGTTYTVLATPATFGSTGQRYFFTDESGVIRYGLNSAADITSSPLQ